MDWSHPVLALVALTLGVAVGWALRRRALHLDITIRHSKEDDHDPAG